MRTGGRFDCKSGNHLHFWVCFGVCIQFGINLNSAYIFGFVLDFDYIFRIDILHIWDYFAVWNYF